MKHKDIILLGKGQLPVVMGASGDAVLRGYKGHFPPPPPPPWRSNSMHLTREDICTRETVGVCRKSIPNETVISEFNLIAAFPDIFAKDKCHDFRPHTCNTFRSVMGKKACAYITARILE